MLQKNNRAPPEKEAQDAAEFDAQLEAVRNDPRVRDVIESYCRILDLLAKWKDQEIKDREVSEIGKQVGKQLRKLLEFYMWLEFREERKWDKIPLDTLRPVIGWIGRVYREVTGKSPRTKDPLFGKHPFSDFVIELFKREGLDPPSTYTIRQVIKR